MRSRPLFVRYARIHRLRRTMRHGIAGPLLLATALAFAGHEMSGAQPVVSPVAAPAKAPAVPSTARRSAGLSAELLRGAAVPARTAPRATRSRTRTARPAAPAWVRPSYGPLTSPFGYRWGKLHKGVDFGAPYGSPIYAASAGTVIYAGPEGGYGRLVLIRHAGGVVTAYGHMSRYAVRVGQRVSAGQIIAYVGSAGHSTGPHLHFEVRPGGGAAINPLPFLRAHGVRV